MLEDGRFVAMLPTVKTEAARRFYAETLGLELVRDDGFGMVFRGEGANLRLQKVESFTPQRFTALGWEVSDLRAKAKAFAGRGVVFERFEGMEQDADAIWVPPGSSGGVCWFKDPDGNLLSLNQAGT